MSHRGAARWLGPGHKECLCKSQCWLRDVVKWEVGCTECDGCGVPVGALIDKMLGEPTREGGAVNSPKLVQASLNGSGGRGLERARRRRGNLRGAKSPGGGSDPKPAAGTMDSDKD